ncbi:zinc-binding dehydrogenase [Clavibacter michiganensis subsp. phaseoli]|uniref:Zinc-binding dehydrogenase n=1 Tax=Clavibacter phaseoli TaxID=1734031 RepID=A0A8I0VE54_9MICO|nr:zinc-binding dehydrogenase [Clavibacter phaseoli]MBF4632595.1 zinc-binding dehydrogenase [Clavibacter phaseoli]
MKGYVLHEKGRAAWADVPESPLGDYDAMIRPTAVATCTTDVHLIATAGLPAAIGKPIGHEAVGVVEKIGDLVTDFAPGDRVIIPAAGSDWRNPHAQRGEAKYYQTHNPYFSSDKTVGGAFSELVRAIDADMSLAHIPDSVSDVQAVMVPDMVATGFTGVERLQIEFGDTVVIMGVGPVGLMAVAGAALRGAGRIIAVGSRPATLELARRYGATDVVDYKKAPILDQVQQLLGDTPADSVLIASGATASDSFSTALTLVKPGGHVANVSVFLDEESVTIPLAAIGSGTLDKFLTGVFVKDGRDFLERLLALIATGRLDPSPLVTHQLHGWDRLEDALDLMRSHDPDVIKPVVLL